MTEPITYRVYFNRWADAPMVWSVDQGDISTEINVSAIHMDAPCTTGSNPACDNVREPRAWFELTGHLTVSNGVATIVTTKSALARAA